MTVPRMTTEDKKYQAQADARMIMELSGMPKERRRMANAYLRKEAQEIDKALAKITTTKKTATRKTTTKKTATKK